MALTQEDLQITKQIHEAFETTRKEEKDLESVERFRNVDPKEYEEVFNKAAAKIESIEEDVDGHIDSLASFQEVINEREEDDQFQKWKRNDTIDEEDYDNVREALNEAIKLVKMLANEKKIYETIVTEMDKMISTQQLTHDQGRVKDYIDEMSDWQKKQFDRTIEGFEEYTKRMENSFEDYIKHRDNKIEETLKSRDEAIENLLEEFISFRETQIESKKALAESINKLSRSLGNEGKEISSDQNQRNQDQSRDKEPQDEDEEEIGYQDLSEVQKKVLHLVEDPEYEDDEAIAEEAERSISRVRSIKSDLRRKGLID